MLSMPSSSRTTHSRSRGSRDPLSFVCNSLAAKAQSVAEIEAKLAARGVPAARAAAIVQEAVRLGYLDDAELAGQLARGLRARRYGRRRAAQALRRRRGAEPGADAALAAVYDGADEDALALSALGSRPTDDDASRRRAASFLVRRGFSPAAAWRAVRHARAP